MFPPATRRRPARRAVSVGARRRLLDREQELRIRGRVLEAPEQQLDRLLLVERAHDAAQLPDDLQLLRRDEDLLAPEELKIIWKLRRVMGALDQQQAIELLLGRLKDTSSNAEFLLTVQKTTPGAD